MHFFLFILSNWKLQILYDLLKLRPALSDYQEHAIPPKTAHFSFSLSCHLYTDYLIVYPTTVYPITIIFQASFYSYSSNQTLTNQKLKLFYCVEPKIHH